MKDVYLKSIFRPKNKDEFNKAFASFLLAIPIPMNYGVWKALHKIKGDWIE